MVRTSKPAIHKTAATAHAEKMASIRDRIAELQSLVLEMEAKAKADPRNWCHVGDAGYVDNLLGQAISFLDANNPTL